MEITLITFIVVMALFLAVPLTLISLYGLNIMRQTVLALIRFVAMTAVYALAFYFVVRSSSIVADILFALAVVAFASLSVIGRGRLQAGKFFLPVGAGMVAGVLPVVVCLVLCLPRGEGGVVTFFHFVAPLAALVAVSVVEPTSAALTTYYAGLRNHNQLYYYLLGNGATRAEALDFLFRRALTKAISRCAASMALVGTVVAPTVMWTATVGGATAFSAAAFQILVVIGSFTAALIAVIVALLLARRYSLDEYGRLGNSK